MFIFSTLALSVVLTVGDPQDQSAQKLAEEAALVERCSIRPQQLRPLAIETVLVEGGRPRAIICHADEPAWREAALVVQKAVRETTGVELPLETDTELSADEFANNDLILLGHLDNHRWVARLYHNFFVCLDAGFTGRSGYVLRSVHDPFGSGHNDLVVGGSFAEGTRKAAEAFAQIVRHEGTKGNLTLGRLLNLNFDPDGRQDKLIEPLSAKAKDAAIADGRRLMFSPGRGRSGIGRLISAGVAYHRSGDLAQAEVCHDLFLALDEYFRTDPYINENGMGRYDRDFRDAYTYQVAIVWDLVEESGLFSDEQRLAITNLLVRLGLECTVYQHWNTPARVRRWEANKDIVHNHLTFPALSVYFVGRYLKRHYRAAYVDDWLKVAHGIFNGQKHSRKPMEDSASYEWLPIIHTMIYSLAENDLTFFDEGHARQAADAALMAMDNAGYQAAYGDHASLTSASGLAPVLQVAGWYYRSPGFVWGANLAGRGTEFYLGQTYSSSAGPQPPADHVGVRVLHLPRQSYDFAVRNTAKGPGPTLPFEQVFDKLSLRGGWQKSDEYLFLDGDGRGNHMHFDVQAIIRYAAGAEPLLVDGEYIKSLPKYHNSLVIIRDGQAEPAPAVAGLGRADDLGTTAYTRTWVTEYNGADWTRCLLWRRGEYLLVRDEVRAVKPGRYTLRCCWRPWGEAALHGRLLEVTHAPMRLLVANADGASSNLEALKTVGGLPVSRWSQQVSTDLKKGRCYRFLNVVRAEPLEKRGTLAVRRVAEDVVAIQRAQTCDVAAFEPGDDKLPGLRTDAEVVVLGPGRLTVVGGKTLFGNGMIFDASVPISLELDYTATSGTLLAQTPGEVKLRLSPGNRVRCGETLVAADSSGVARLAVSAGSYPLRFDPCSPEATLVAAREQLATRPAIPSRATAGSMPGATLAPIWQRPAVPAPPEQVAVESVRSSVAPSASYPLEHLTDGAYKSSTTSTMWGRGVAPEITIDLGREVEIQGVILREWHGNPGWSVGSRKLCVSGDGFQKDVRQVEGTFAAVDEYRSGRSRNVAMRIPVKQKARQIRVALAPEDKKSSVYLSEIEVTALVPGKVSRIRACAAGDLTGDGNVDVVVASDSGQLSAVSPRGTSLWTYEFPDRASIDAVACADVDGDGRAEVLFGGGRARLGLVGGDGRLRWETHPAMYRGVPSDVKTVFAADVTGDGRPEVICGCASWQYFAYDAQGQTLWNSVIYAHSATVGCGVDLDGDRRAETIAGNAYYQLNVLGHDGRRRWVAGTVTPEMTAVAAGDIDGDKVPEVLCGMDSGELFCFDAAGKRRWQKNLGDKITRIVPLDLTSDGVAEIACAAESAQIVALAGDGRILWRAALPDGSTDLAAINAQGGPLLVAAAGSAGLAVMDRAGQTVAHAPCDGGAEEVVLAGDLAVAVTRSGRLEAFRISNLSAR